jgi:phosphoribosyl-dephospho-CoA transferase
MSRAPHPLPRVHDLLLLRSPKIDAACTAEPSWVSLALNRTPWVVVRRTPAEHGKLAVGVRGIVREERWAAFIDLSQITLTRKPMHLRSSHVRDDRKTLPAIKALMFAEAILDHTSFEWGPTGSVGFELATGALTTTEDSDLDVVLFASHRIDTAVARYLLLSLTGSAAKIDLRVETPFCGFSLEEYARPDCKKVLVRTPTTQRLVEDPWDVPEVGNAQ